VQERAERGCVMRLCRLALTAKQCHLNRGREVQLGWTPLPPNRTGGFPAYGSPVSSCPDGIGRNEGGPLAD
jgi:hypothetical protein